MNRHQFKRAAILFLLASFAAVAMAFVYDDTKVRDPMMPTKAKIVKPPPKENTGGG